MDSVLRHIFPAFCGFNSDGSCRGNLTESDIKAITALLEVSRYEIRFLGMDLDATEFSGLQQKFTQEQWDNLRNHQCQIIRNARRSAYKTESDGLKHEADYDGTDPVEWRNKVAEIKARFPWPGEYR